jgi:drug/metabolite transporter (DMT)-like permease
VRLRVEIGEEATDGAVLRPGSPRAGRPATGAWIPFALLGFAAFGITNFLLGVVGEWTHDPAASISAPFLVWLAMGAAGVGAATAFKATGRGYAGIPSRNLAWAVVIAGLTLSLGMMTLKIGLASEPLARAPIVAIGSASSVLVAVLACVVLHERLSRPQLLGFVIVVAGIAIMGLSGGLQASLVGVAFGVLTLILFGITNFLLTFVGHNGANSITATAILWATSGACGIVAISALVLSGRGLAGMETPGPVIVSLVAGLFLALGMLALKVAVSRGQAGPATAIIGSNALLVTLLDLAFFGLLPPPAKTAGMLVVLVGIVILALGARQPREALR